MFKKFVAIPLMAIAIMGGTTTSINNDSGVFEKLFTKNTRETNVSTSDEFINALNNDSDIFLENDIDFNGYEINDQIDTYSGTINGDDHKLINLNEDYSNNKWGLYLINNFSGTLQNISFKNSYLFAKTIDSATIESVNFFDTQITTGIKFNPNTSTDGNEINFGIFAGEIKNSIITNFKFNNNYINNVLFRKVAAGKVVDFNFGLMAGIIENTTLNNVVFDTNGVMDLILQAEPPSNKSTTLNVGTIAGRSVDSTYEDVILARTMWLDSVMYSNEINFGNYIGNLESSTSTNHIDRTYNAGIAFSNTLFLESDELASINTSFGVVGDAEISNFVESYPQYKWDLEQDPNWSIFSSSDLSGAELTGVYSASDDGSISAPGVVESISYDDLDSEFWIDLYSLPGDVDFWNHNYLVKPVSFVEGNTPNANLEYNASSGFPIKQQTIVLSSQIDFQNNTSTPDVFNFEFSITNEDDAAVTGLLDGVVITLHSIFDDDPSGFILYDGNDGGLNPLFNFDLSSEVFNSIAPFLSRLNDWFWIEISSAIDPPTFEFMNSSQVTNSSPLTYNAPFYSIEGMYEVDEITSLPSVSFTIKNDLDDGTNSLSPEVRSSENLRVGMSFININGGGITESVSQALIDNNTEWTYTLPLWIDSVEALNQWYYFSPDSLTFKYIGQDKTIQEGMVEISVSNDLQSTTETLVEDSTIDMNVEYLQSDEMSEFNISTELNDPSKRFYLNDDSAITISLSSEFNAFIDDEGNNVNQIEVKLGQDDFNYEETSYVNNTVVNTTFDGPKELIPMFFAINIDANLNYIKNAEQTEVFSDFALSGDLNNSTLENDVYDDSDLSSPMLNTSYDQESNKLTVSLTDTIRNFRYMTDFSISLQIHDANSIIGSTTLNKTDNSITISLTESIKTVLDENDTYTINDFIYFTISDPETSYVTYFDINGSTTTTEIIDLSDLIEGDVINDNDDNIFDADEIIESGFPDNIFNEDGETHFIVVTLAFLILFAIILGIALNIYHRYK